MVKQLPYYFLLKWKGDVHSTFKCHYSLCKVRCLCTNA
jgi:hypothetical protein